MKTFDTLRYAGHALGAARLRLQLLMLAVAIGVFAVVVLTALGEGTRRYVLSQFETLGSDLASTEDHAPRAGNLCREHGVLCLYSDPSTGRGRDLLR